MTGSTTSTRSFISHSGRSGGHGQCGEAEAIPRDTTRPVEGLLGSTYAKDDKARLSPDLAGLHEEVAELLGLLGCCDIIQRLIFRLSQHINIAATTYAIDTTPRRKDEEVRVERTAFLCGTS